MTTTAGPAGAGQAATAAGKAQAPRNAGLRLRPVRLDDEAAFRAAHLTLAASDGFPFGLAYEPAAPWPAFVQHLAGQRAGQDLPDGWVPSTFLVADVAGQIVGRISIRHKLNDFLAREGGHIGYAVLPPYRRRGYATEILRQGLIVARSHGVDRVLVTCDDTNIGSAAVIESCGGQWESVIASERDGQLIRRYWIG